MDLLREAIVEAASSAPDLSPKNEAQDDAAPDDFLEEEEENGESNPTSTHVGPE